MVVFSSLNLDGSYDRCVVYGYLGAYECCVLEDAPHEKLSLLQVQSGHFQNSVHVIDVTSIGMDQWVDDYHHEDVPPLARHDDWIIWAWESATRLEDLSVDVSHLRQELYSMRSERTQ